MRLRTHYQKRITIWFLETGCEALLISVLLLELFGPGRLSVSRDLAAAFFGTLFFFFTTGYLLTTAIADALWRSRRVWLYPVVASVLFCLHLQILFMVAGGWSSAERLPVRVVGPCIVFVCTYVGSAFHLKQKSVPAPFQGGCC